MSDISKIGGAIENIGEEINIPVVGDVINWVGEGLQFFDSIFGGSTDKGHWEGNLFIPGDLPSRWETVYKWINQLGLSINQIDLNKIDLMLKSTGGWQDKVKQYLYSITNQQNVLKTNLNESKTLYQQKIENILKQALQNQTSAETTVKKESNYLIYIIPAIILLFIIFTRK